MGLGRRLNSPSRARIVLMAPKSTVMEAGHRQVWGGTANGFVVNILNRAGIEFDDNGQIQILYENGDDALPIDDIEKFLQQMENTFGHTVQQRPDKPAKIYRGPRDRWKDGEIFYHGTRRGCEEFLKEIEERERPYNAQQNAQGNIIVVLGSRIRNSYTIVFEGTLEECLRYKLDN
ncbi:uncharacterized protein METZ01_LOCUS404722 [marine metagenome]|uniref:Uncharacterized protein n=1 Tax=marine metagenome TaxID=408172 RepID=A0A382W159_9ZZZZ